MLFSSITLLLSIHPQRLHDVLPGRPESGKNPPHQPHDEREEERFVENLEGEGETEGQLGKCLEIHGRNREKLEKRRQEQSRAAADEPQQKGFNQERGQDAAALESQRPERADFAGAVGHGGIHGYHGADYRTQGKDDRQRNPQDAQKLGHHLRLVRIVFRFPPRIHREPGVMFQPVLDFVESPGVGKLEGHRGVNRPAESLHELVGITPDLGTEAAVPRIEYAGHQPVPHAEAQGFPHTATLETAGNARSDHDFGRAGTAHPSLHYPHLRPERQRFRADSPYDHVGRIVAPLFRQVDQNHHFLCQELPAVHSIGNLGQSLDDGGLLPFHAALHLGSRALSYRDDVIGRAGVHQCLAQPGRQHQDRRKDEHHEGHAGCGEHRGQAPGPEIPEAV